MHSSSKRTAVATLNFSLYFIPATLLALLMRNFDVLEVSFKSIPMTRMLTNCIRCCTYYDWLILSRNALPKFQELKLLDSGNTHKADECPGS